MLDRFGGVGKGHTALARHLYDDHAVPAGTAQGITVAYERARGVRAVNQRCDGEYEVSVSKVVNATTADVVRALTDERRAQTLDQGSGPCAGQGARGGVDSTASKGVVVRADGQGRYRYKWGKTTVQLYLMPKGGDKVSLVVTNSKLADGAMVEARRTQWRAAVNALAQLFARAQPR